HRQGHTAVPPGRCGERNPVNYTAIPHTQKRTRRRECGGRHTETCSMSLYAKLRAREAAGRPVRIALIGAGKFGSMYLAQIPRTPGVHLAAIADLNPDAARTNLERVGWSPQRSSRSEEHTSELQSRENLVCRLL